MLNRKGREGITCILASQKKINRARPRLISGVFCVPQVNYNSTVASSSGAYLLNTLFLPALLFYEFEGIVNYISGGFRVMGVLSNSLIIVCRDTGLGHSF